MRLNIVLILFLVIFVSCQRPSNNVTHLDSINNNPTDNTKKLDIPYINGKPSPIYEAVRHYEKELQLLELVNGYDSIQIRIWYWFGGAKTSQLFIIKSRRNQWIAENILIGHTFIYSPYDSLRKTIINIIDRKPARPKTSWASAMRKLYQKDLLTLPDILNIKGYEIGIHGNSLAVEIATRDEYRMYYYREPIFFKDKFEEAQKMEDIILLLEDEFGFMRQDFI